MKTTLLKILVCVQLVLASATQALAQGPSLQFAQRPPLTSDAGISAGIAWGDFNNDDYPDLFVANWAGQNNQLYLNNGDGTFLKIVSGPVVETGGYSSGGCWGDYDNDGHLDLFVANQRNENNFLFHNEGDGSFTQIRTGDIVNDFGDSYSALWADYDNDGWLDLYVCNSNQPNFLYHGNGDGTFTSVRDDPVAQFVGSNFGAAWGDYDNDGYPDLFVAERGGGPNRLFHNDSGLRFSEVLSPAISGDSATSNGGSWGDFDNDGLLDLFVANGAFFFNKQSNFLYRNLGGGQFERVPETMMPRDSSESMSGCWSDFDLDGDLDLFVTTYVHDNCLYLNTGDGHFEKLTQPFVTRFGGYSTGVGVADIDLDGDPDLAIANWENQNNNLFLNQASSNQWLGIVLHGVTSNRLGLGARITVVWSDEAGVRMSVREVSSGYGFRSQNETAAHFGLGSGVRADSVVCRWPSGVVDTLTNVDANQIVVIAEGRGLEKIVASAPIGTSTSPPATLVETLTDVTEGIEAILDSVCTNHSAEVDCSESSLVQFGYSLLFSGRSRDAQQVFQYGTLRFPNSANMHDCVAEACEISGDTLAIVAASKRVLETVRSDESLNQETRLGLENNARYRLKRFVD